MLVLGYGYLVLLVDLIMSLHLAGGHNVTFVLPNSNEAHQWFPEGHGVPVRWVVSTGTKVEGVTLTASFP